MLMPNTNTPDVTRAAGGTSSLRRKTSAAQAQHKTVELAGRIQRIDYDKRSVALIYQNEVWRFQVPCDCHLHFDGEPAILRCFHPLDKVTLVFVEDCPDKAHSIAGWDASRASTSAASGS